MKFLKNFNKATLPVFQKSLFFEGLRQLRVAGIAYTVIASLLTLGNVIPGQRDATYTHTYTLVNLLSDQLDDAPMAIFLLASFFAVIAVFYLTGFMRSAKARDFYCATPHSHGTLWLNFTASALTWTAAGVLAFLLMCCAVLMPFDPKVFGTLLFIACGIFSAVCMVFGMATLAATLTGRLVPGLVTLAGFLTLSTCLKVAYSEGYNAVFTKFNLVTAFSDLEMVDPIYYILRRMFLPYTYNNFYAPTVYRIFSSWATVGYGLLTGAVLLAVAAVFGIIRTGDAVGRPFVNEAAHVLSLTSVTLPIGTLISSLVFKVCEYLLFRNRYNLFFLFDRGGLFGFLLAALVLAGSFWAVELALTFDIRHSHRAFKYSPLPFTVAMAALLIGFFSMWGEFNTVPAADEVASFTLVRNDILPDEIAFFRLSDSFGRCVTEDAEFTDQETIRYVTTVIKTLSDKNGHDLQKAYNSPDIWINEETGVSDSRTDGKGNPFVTLRLNLKNGRHLLRRVSFDQTHIKGLEEAILGDSAFMKSFLTLPSAEKINLGIDDHNGLTETETLEIYKTFAEEYGSLSDAEKIAFIRESVTESYTGQYTSEEEVAEEEATAPEAETEEELVAPERESRTDLNLISQSKNTGDWGIAESYYDESALEGSVTIVIAGYAEGRLYDENYHFSQIFEPDSRRFPKTMALIVKTCNAKFDGIPDQIKKVGSGDKYRFCDIDARYYSEGKILNVLYLYISGKDAEDIRLSVAETSYSRYGEDENVTVRDIEEENVTVRNIEVDSNEMIERLFRDAAATETVDFTKPYCKFTWNNYDSYRNGLPGFMTFYAQTENPVDYLHLLDTENGEKK